MFALLIIIAVVLWLDAFLLYGQVALPTENNAPLYSLVASVFSNRPFLSVLLSFLFMILQAWMFNRVITGKNLVDRNSMLPALVYIVLMSSSFSLFGLHPVWFANFFLIITLDKMFDVFRDEAVFVEIFNVGFFVSLASLFYFPALIFIFLIISALIIYFLVNIRGIIASLIGLFLPYMFAALYYYWNDISIAEVFLAGNIQVDVAFLTRHIIPFGWVSIIVIGLTGLIAVSRLYLGALRDKPVRIRKRYQVLFIYLIIAVVSVLIAGKTINIHHGIIMLPLSAIVAGFFQENKKSLLNEIIFTLLLLLMLVGKLARLD
ncbi:MAG: hypothetical protein EA361_12820 [Bacteroidetes bacterium]|nr:MAG: hypothetical protein EA361_12820 [Bacteroidota bacterium]